MLASTPDLRSGNQAYSVQARSLRVTWSGSDADGDRLHYLVRASTDGGTTWQTIGVDLDQPHIDLNASDFASQRVLLQVFASDGLHTTHMQLGPFAVQP